MEMMKSISWVNTQLEPCLSIAKPTDLFLTSKNHWNAKAFPIGIIKNKPFRKLQHYFAHLFSILKAFLSELIEQL